MTGRATLVAGLFTTLAVFPATSPVDQDATNLRNHPAVATLLRMVDAVNAGDARAYAAAYAPGAVITIYGGEVLRGRDAIERYELELLRAFPGTRLALSAIWMSGSTGAVRYGVNSPAGAGPATGHEGMLFYRFNDEGGIVEERRYLDALTPMSQAGAFGSGSVRPIPTLPREPAIAMASPGGTAGRVAAALFAALDAGDAAGFLAALSDDVAIDEMMLADAFTGRSGALAWFRILSGAVSDGKTDITSMMQSGDVVLVETIVRGRLTGPIGRLSATGKTFAIHRAAAVRLLNGRILEITVFTNGRELAQETGQWPPAAGR
jgi:ketosteroid isomerase-like protein